MRRAKAAASRERSDVASGGRRATRAAFSGERGSEFAPLPPDAKALAVAGKGCAVRTMRTLLGGRTWGEQVARLPSATFHQLRDA